LIQNKVNSGQKVTESIAVEQQIYSPPLARICNLAKRSHPLARICNPCL